MDEQSSLLTPVLHNIQRPPGSGDALDGTTSPSAAVSVSSDPPMPEDTGRFGRPYFRFTIVFAALIVVIATMPLWLSAATPKYSVAVCGSITILIGLEWLAIAANAVLNYRRLSRVPIPNWPDVVALRSRRFKHIVIVPCYLDPLDVLQKCIGSLAVSARAQDLITVVTFERKTPELERKMEAVQVAFGDSCFGDFLAVVHDLDPATEIPGGCSNKNFALRTAFAFCTRKYGTILNDHTTRVTLTTCDTDSLFHPLYFEVLESAYNTENPTKGAPRNCVWQPPLFYNWGLDSRPFFNRVTCLMRTMMMLGGLISFNLNPMSIFSYPLEMGYAAGFINPRYGVDDIIAKVRWMCDTNSAVPVKLLPVPVISGPTIGQSFAEEATEWGRQIRRWIVGSSESFHYFLIHFRGRPFFAGLAWFATFFSYYGVLLCCAGVFSVFAAIPLPWQDEAFLNVPGGFRFNLRYCGAVSLGLQMVAFAVAFLIDAVGAPRLGVKEDIHPIRNLIHWITSPFVLLTYSVISLVSIVRFVFQGKKMAGHDMAAKEGFSSVSQPLPSTAASVSESPAARWQVVQSRGSILP